MKKTIAQKAKVTGLTRIRASIAKMDANDRALLVATINAALASWDGEVPNRLRLDRDTLEIVALCPVLDESKGIVRMLRPMLVALRAAKRGAA